jgi:hypothetical protein
MLTDAVIGNKLDEAMESESETKTDQSNDQKTKGLMEGLTGLVGMTGLVMILPIIICVIVLVIFVLPMFKGGSKFGSSFGRKVFSFGKRGFRFGRR